jgi:hypothetical protein
MFSLNQFRFLRIIDRHPDGSYALLDERLRVNRSALIGAFF